MLRSCRPSVSGFRNEGRNTKGQKEALRCAAQLPFQMSEPSRMVGKCIENCAALRCAAQLP